jgi:nitrite reductase/ring-hydroxylating ferredoxin subunit/uncharacterized membrane protein
MSVHALLSRVEGWPRLDRPAGVLRRGVDRTAGPPAVRDLLHGVPFGHPLHPALAQGSLGFFLSAGLLDAVGQRRAATVLIGAGVASATPTAAAGLLDWSQAHEQQQRVGLVHAAANSVGLAAYVVSLAARASGRPGRASAYLGLTALSAGAFLGGHLGYRQALGANHAEQVPHRVPEGWSTLCPLESLGDGKPEVRLLGNEPVLVIRQGGEVTALSDVCSHLAGPLHEGELVDGCIECPWHGSRFRLTDGSVARGPATAPVPAFETRVLAGEVQVRLPGAG